MTGKINPIVQDHESTPPFVLAIDVGTSSTRTMLFDAAGSAVSGVLAQQSYKLTTSQSGEVSVDADMLLNIITQTIDQALQAAGDKAKQIKAVALDTFWHSLLGVDEHDHALTPIITWEDTRASQAARDRGGVATPPARHEAGLRPETAQSGTAAAIIRKGGV